MQTDLELSTLTSLCQEYCINCGHIDKRDINSKFPNGGFDWERHHEAVRTGGSYPKWVKLFLFK